MPNALDSLRSLRAISRGGALSAFARRFTAGRALFAGDDARDGGETDGASSARARRRREPAEIVRIDVMGRAQYYPGAPPFESDQTPRAPPGTGLRATISQTPNPAIGSAPRAHRTRPLSRPPHHPQCPRAIVRTATPT